jgi:hypothetical protein
MDHVGRTRTHKRPGKFPGSLPEMLRGLKPRRCKTSIGGCRSSMPRVGPELACLCPHAAVARTSNSGLARRRLARGTPPGHICTTAGAARPDRSNTGRQKVCSPNHPGDGCRVWPFANSGTTHMKPPRPVFGNGSPDSASAVCNGPGPRHPGRCLLYQMIAARAASLDKERPPLPVTRTGALTLRWASSPGAGAFALPPPPQRRAQCECNRLACRAFLSKRLHRHDPSGADGPDPSHGNVEVSFSQPAGAQEPSEYQHAITVILEAPRHRPKTAVLSP